MCVMKKVGPRPSHITGSWKCAKSSKVEVCGKKPLKIVFYNTYLPIIIFISNILILDTKPTFKVCLRAENKAMCKALTWNCNFEYLIF